MGKIQPLKAIEKIVTAPFKSVGNILSGKGNLGDFAGIASLFAPGGSLANLSFGSIGKSTLGSVGQNFLGSLGPQDLLSLFQGSPGGGGTAGGGAASAGLGPIEMELLMKALGFLDPAVQGDIIERNTSTLLRDADRFSTGFGERLSQQTGNPNLGAQVQLGARNQAVGQANQFASGVRSPGGQLDLFRQALGLTGQAVGIQGQRAGIDAIRANIRNQGRLTDESLRQPTFFEQLFSAGVNFLPGHLDRQGSKPQAAGEFGGVGGFPELDRSGALFGGG